MLNNLDDVWPRTGVSLADRVIADTNLTRCGLSIEWLLKLKVRNVHRNFLFAIRTLSRPILPTDDCIRCKKKLLEPWCNGGHKPVQSSLHFPNDFDRISCQEHIGSNFRRIPVALWKWEVSQCFKSHESRSTLRTSSASQAFNTQSNTTAFSLFHKSILKICTLSLSERMFLIANASLNATFVQQISQSAQCMHRHQNQKVLESNLKTKHEGNRKGRESCRNKEHRGGH